MKNSFEYVQQIAAINKIIEIKKYGIREDYEYLLKDSRVHSLIDQVATQTGLDLLSISSAKDYAIYESHIKKILYNELSIEQNANLIDEEIELINHSFPFSASLYRTYNVRVPQQLKDLKLNDKLLTNPELISIIRSPEKIEVVKLENTYSVQLNVLISSVFRFRSKELYILAHLSENRNQPGVFIINSYFYFEYLSAVKLSPSRMFLKAINRYGVPIKVGNKKGKFIFNNTVSSLSIDPAPTLAVEASRQGKHVLAAQYTPRPQGGADFFMCYGLNATAVNNDFTKLNFL